jgi:hypothetical protein
MAYARQLLLKKAVIPKFCLVGRQSILVLKCLSRVCYLILLDLIVVVVTFEGQLSKPELFCIEWLMTECRHVLTWKLSWPLLWLWDPPMNIANAYCLMFAFLQGIISVVSFAFMILQIQSGHLVILAQNVHDSHTCIYLNFRDYS